MIEQHFCSTTYIFNPQGTKTLLIKHKKLGFYFPAGGHIDPNENYFESALREVKEELGINNLVVPEYLCENTLGGIQPLAIQTNKLKDNHHHFDLIFAGIVEENVLISPQEGESQDIVWFEVNDVKNINTKQEVIDHINNISNKIKENNVKQIVKDDLYMYPRYSDNVSIAMGRFLLGEDFNSWNLGDIYTEIPTQYANKMNCKYGIFCNSGTSGLHASLLAIGVKTGDEVIVPSMTFVRSVSPLNHLGVIPIIADIDEFTGNIDPESIIQNITAKTKAVIVVHMWGIPADCHKIREICNRHKISMIEDFSHAHYSKYQDSFVGQFGDVSFASLQRKKNLSVGEGGIITTNNSDIFERLKDITSPGSFPTTTNYSQVDFSGFGLNMRMSPFSAVVAKSIFPEIDKILDKKRQNLKILVDLITSNTQKIQLQKIPSYTDFDDISWYSYKPTLSGTTLEELKKLSLWKFGDFGYSPIASHKYWDKDPNYFPFSNNLKPVVKFPLISHDKYMANRISLNIPSIDSEYWTPQTLEKWAKELQKL